MTLLWEQHWQALQETRLWCEQHLLDHTLNQAEEPEVRVIPLDNHRSMTYSVSLQNCLRSAVLRPQNYPEDWGYLVLNAPEIETLLKKRRTLLNAAGEPTLRGRILCVGEETDTYMGEGVPASKGFIDEIYMPPWDTWFAYLPGEKASEGVLLAWIPERLVEQVQTALEAAATQPLMWLDELHNLEEWGGREGQQVLVREAHGALQHRLLEHEGEGS
ncbi:hypothetical protein [Deinococcus roseus]|uniref:Uncharacterized protein n=1 Tax=Deinococcus roseus TaxID=392414 RepID=A0ABQ2D6V5_9DEIO|nr:hypothetical protein [Deinococcus roseus]GGJ47519.1 hypothetical protein GCM10008938_36880 [Deinococcus roseus]